MGGFPSSTTSTSSPAIVDKQHDVFSLDTQHVDNFLRLFVAEMPVEDSLQAFLSNSFAAESFADYMEISQGKASFKVTDDEDFLLDPLIMRTELTKKYTSPNSTASSKLVTTMCELLPGFMTSASFREWRQSEVRAIIETFGKWIAISKVTLPELRSVLSERRSVFEAPAEICGIASDNYCTAEVLYSPLTSPLNLGLTSAMPLPNTLACNPDFNPVIKSMSRCSIGDLRDIFTANSWLPVFISAVEMLPISVTVSHCMNNTFPIMYVNASFEEVSGRKREDIIGRPGTFLQTSATLHLPQQRTILDSIICNVKLQNFSQVLSIKSSRFSGEMFSNIIGIRSIAQKSELPDPPVKYVITIQHEEKPDENQSFWMNRIEKFLNTLPYTI
mmetsp:Transcript_11375/g.11403  ORF Transcript_11375/g.11403 Transcript_11375/m.11403 type:complete len:388 (+) Transcript_11375:164-1327(+)